MNLLHFHVQEDWQQYDSSNRMIAQKIWRNIVLLISILMVFIFITSFIFNPAAVAWGVIRTILVPIIYFGFSILFAFQIRKTHNGQGTINYRTIFGLRIEHKIYDIIIGLLFGGILGLNFVLLSLYLIPGGNSFQPLRPIDVMVAILMQLVLVAIGEEMLLRGIAYYCLYEKGNETLIRTILFIALLNTLMYIVQIAKFIGTDFSFWLAIYRFGFGVLATILRYRQDSTFTSLAANMIFNLMLLTVLPW
jgi:membrane protease YdiL (CAAX protease family)